jgi:hypothetical protein
MLRRMNALTRATVSDVLRLALLHPIGHKTISDLNVTGNIARL